MAFQDQVQDLTSLSVSDTGELSQFLKDGVVDVTSRWLAIRPQDAEQFQRESSTIDSNGGLDVGGAKIISVIREAGADGSTDGSTAWEACRKISASMQSRVVDTESLQYASKYNPAYIIDDNGKVNVYPVASANNGYRVFFVNNVPTDETNEVALIHSHSDVKWFPNDKVYLVVMYAGIRLLNATMGSSVISLTSVPPDVPTLPSAPSTPSDPSISSPGISTVTVGSLGTAPTLTASSITTRVSFNDFFESGSLNPFDDSDPGAISITAVPPDTPSIASIAYATASNADATAQGVTSTASLVSEQGTIDVSSSAPAYATPTQTISGANWVDEYPLAEVDLTTPLAAIATNVGLAKGAIDAPPVPPDIPTLSSTSIASFGITAPAYNNPNVGSADEEITASMDADSAGYGTDADFLNFSKWFSVAGDLIEDQEDVELASAQIQKISTYLQSYSLAMQNQLNIFNDANVEFQADVQRKFKEADFDNQEDARLLQKFSAEVQEYQAEIGEMSARSQGYIQTAQGYANEIKTRLSITQTKIGEYQAKVQDALNAFNRANVLFQMDFQEAVTKENQDLQVAMANANNLAQEYRQEAKQITDIDQFNKAQDQVLNLANAAKAMEDDISDNNSKIQKFSAEIQAYQAEVGAEVQEYTQKLQRYQVEMNTAYQAWAKTESDSLQQYQLDIQANLNEFNEDNAIYQSTVAQAMKDADIAAAEAQKEGDLTFQATIQDYSQELALFNGELQKYQAEVQAKIAKYQAETVEYQAEVAAETQEQSVKMQQYQLLYNQLKAEYDQAFMIAAPKQQPQQVRA